MNKNINNKSIVPVERIEQIIFIIRKQKVILDSDLAALYGIETKTLNRAIKRNIERFPESFVFQLTKDEAENLKYQIGTSSYGGRRKLPYAFTEHGALMSSNFINSPQAISMSLAIIQTFIKLRQLLSTNKDLAHRLDELEKKYDEQFQDVFYEIKRLGETPEEPEMKIAGFNG